MRVSPVGWAFESETVVLREAAKSAAVTHDHPEGIRGAQATALAVYLARKGAGREDIRQTLADRFDYDLQRRLDTIRPHYTFRVSCQESVPEALICFLDSIDFESAVRNAVSLGGDSDTQACIAGGVAEAFYGPLPDRIRREVSRRLPDAFLETIRTFTAAFRPHPFSSRPSRSSRPDADP